MNRRETLMARFFKKQVLANNAYFTTYYPNDVTMKLSLAQEILKPSTQSQPAQINSTHLSCPTVWTTSRSHSLFKESRHLAIVNKLHSATLTDIRPHWVPVIQAVVIDDPVDCHPDCHACGLYKASSTDQRPA